MSCAREKPANAREKKNTSSTPDRQVRPGGYKTYIGGRKRDKGGHGIALRPAKEIASAGREQGVGV